MCEDSSFEGKFGVIKDLDDDFLVLCVVKERCGFKLAIPISGRLSGIVPHCYCR